MKFQEYHRHLIIFTIDMDDMKDDCPTIKPWPSLTIGRSFYKPIHFKFVVQKDGKKMSI
jgi:hypothetical protein